MMMGRIDENGSKNSRISHPYEANLSQRLPSDALFNENLKSANGGSWID